jgi:hypothetical protein
MGGQDDGWACVVGRLIHSGGGHTWETVQGYTFGQIRVFLREAIAAERRAFRLAAFAARIAQAEGDDFRRAMEDD